MSREFNVIIERDAEGYYVGSVPSLSGCHTQAKSLDVLMKRIQEAIELCLEVEQDEPISSEFIGVQRVWVEKSCSRFCKVARASRSLTACKTAIWSSTRRYSKRHAPGLSLGNGCVESKIGRECALVPSGQL